jgi:hypothetical protein
MKSDDEPSVPSEVALPVSGRRSIAITTFWSTNEPGKIVGDRYSEHAGTDQHNMYPPSYRQQIYSSDHFFLFFRLLPRRLVLELPLAPVSDSHGRTAGQQQDHQAGRPGPVLIKRDHKRGQGIDDSR